MGASTVVSPRRASGGLGEDCLAGSSAGGLHPRGYRIIVRTTGFVQRTMTPQSDSVTVS